MSKKYVRFLFFCLFAAIHQRSKPEKGIGFLKYSQMTATVNARNTSTNSHCIPSKEEKAAPVFCT